jgi:hypothetical protein
MCFFAGIVFATQNPQHQAGMVAHNFNHSYVG